MGRWLGTSLSKWHKLHRKMHSPKEPSSVRSSLTIGRHYAELTEYRAGKMALPITRQDTQRVTAQSWCKSQSGILELANDTQTSRSFIHTRTSLLRTCSLLWRKSYFTMHENRLQNSGKHTRITLFELSSKCARTGKVWAQKRGHLKVHELCQSTSTNRPRMLPIEMTNKVGSTWQVSASHSCKEAPNTKSFKKDFW